VILGQSATVGYVGYSLPLDEWSCQKGKKQRHLKFLFFQMPKKSLLFLMKNYSEGGFISKP